MPTEIEQVDQSQVTVYRIGGVEPIQHRIRASIRFTPDLFTVEHCNGLFTRATVQGRAVGPGRYQQMHSQVYTDGHSDTPVWLVPFMINTSFSVTVVG